MIIPDVNVLVYAYDSASPFHTKAAAWWEARLSGTEPVGLPHVAAFGFLRVITNPRVFVNPLTPAEAAAHVRSWLEQPPVQILGPDPDHIERVLKSLEDLGTAGNLVTDAQMAALAFEYAAVLCAADTDFARFKGLRWFNPLTESGSGPLRSTKPS